MTSYISELEKTFENNLFSFFNNLSRVSFATDLFDNRDSFSSNQKLYIYSNSLN